MKDLPKNCFVCKGDLEEGFLLDMGHGATFVLKYAKGSAPDKPKKVVWRNEGEREELRVVIAKRCTECNRIEIFAGTEAVKR